jgi:hypothetical protein
VPLTFCSTIASYRSGRLAGVVPFERGPLVIPARLREGDLRRIAVLVERKIRQSIEGSVWLEGEESFNEASLVPKSHKRKRFYNTPDPRPFRDDPPSPETARNVRPRT